MAEKHSSAKYRSNGERTIADLLDEYGIPFQHEPDVYLHDRGKQYIWHPDFYLPHYQTVIEYLGLRGDPSYDQITRRKKRIYRKNAYHFVPVYPETLQKDYKSYIFKSILAYLTNRRDDFYTKAKLRQ